MLPWLMLGGAALGALKAETVDKEKAKKDAALKSATARFSPWTGMDHNTVQVKEADPLGSAMQGAGMGLGMGQAFGQAGYHNFSDFGGGSEPAPVPANAVPSGEALGPQPMGMQPLGLPEMGPQMAPPPGPGSYVRPGSVRRF